jgi:4-diphosphocytidyl-2-C-methyl-D-erythritol kinase
MVGCRRLVTMISFPPCKINLGLNVLRKRDDGYHDIETCFFPVPWCDVLEIIPSSETKIFQTGIPIAGEPKTNIVFKAYELVKKDFRIGSVEIHLHKIIPHGAGLGGGSSDAAHALKLLNTIFLLNLSIEQLKKYAFMLGSDCPYFLDERPMIGRGRGEQLESVVVDLSGKYLTLIKPDVHVSTAEAYSGVTPQLPSVSLQEIILKPIVEWRQNLVNDFENSVFMNHPEIAEIKEFLYSKGAIYSSMSGSGSTVYGIFNEPFNAVTFYPNLATWSGKI